MSTLGFLAEHALLYDIRRMRDAEELLRQAKEKFSALQQSKAGAITPTKAQEFCDEVEDLTLRIGAVRFEAEGRLSPRQVSRIA